MLAGGFEVADTASVIDPKFSEKGVEIAERLEHGRGEGFGVIWLVGDGGVERDQFGGLRDGERAEQEGVEKAEERGVRAEGQGERQKGDCSGSWRF